MGVETRRHRQSGPSKPATAPKTSECRMPNGGERRIPLELSFTYKSPSKQYSVEAILPVGHCPILSGRASVASRHGHALRENKQKEHTVMKMMTARLVLVCWLLA